ncbi:Down-regulated in metastasis [Ancylostoma caninum]|uniref:Down-regulated in metastasis n=1 Tax=Ancylostoma caninum TaxID=29170 RepID=A0A368GYN6_ANCCA|nr:Down-regulated in metastasis [Ancylostoma caninum]
MDEQEDAPPPKRQRFKHLTFNQLVGSIGGDSAKFSRRLMQRPDDSELFFIEALTKWNDQSFGADYTSFVDSLPCDELNTHAQLLYHKKTIAELLLKSLQDPACKSIPAFCELLSALVRDLKEDFTEDMWDFFGALTNVLDLGERDVESVEAAFFALSLMVKVMWRQLLKEFSQSFVRFIPLFGSSRPYVRRFAGEAFSFIMRKSSNLRKLCCHVVEQAFKVHDDHLSEGCAELFFHVCKGVGGGFHSAASEQIECIISGVFSLPNQDIRDYGVTILEKTVQLIVQYVQKGTKTDLSFLEILLIHFLEISDSMEQINYSSRLLRLCFVQRRWKNLFSSDKRLLLAVEKVIASSSFELCFDFVDFLLHCAVHVFCGDEWGNSFAAICSKIVSAKGDRTVIFHLFNGMLDVVYFDKYMLPIIGELSDRIFAEETSLIPNVLKLYSLICLSRRPILEAISRRRSPFLDSSSHKSVQKYVLEQIDHLGDMERPIAAYVLAVWPWISSDLPTQCVVNVINYIKDLISSKEILLETSQLALIAVSSAYQVDKNQLKNLEHSAVEQFLRNMKCCESSLRVYQFWLEADREQRKATSLNRITRNLLPCYFNPNASIRHCALEILSSFEFDVEGMEAEEGKGAIVVEENVFNILLAAESCDIIDFRSRLLQFRKLNFGSHRKFMPRGSDTSYDHIILRVGLAQFFVQFTKMWPAMYELLESFARGMSIDDFWAVMSEVLDHINEGCREANNVLCSAPFLEWCDKNNRFDYHSARLQVFKFMSNIWDIAQRRTRILSPMLLKIYESDYLPFIVENMSSCGLSTSNAVENEEADSEAAEDSKTTKNDDKLKITKTLCALLDVYSKFTDAKSVYMEARIREMYDHLLIVGNDMVQKSVIACIFSYKDKALLPYKENFERLLDEKSFREQLVLFSINEEEGNSVVHKDHRPAVMRVLLRFLYGKLWAQTKRNLIESRRAAIFRYLGGCRPDELMEFLKILFAPILDVIGTTDLNYTKMEVLCNDRETLFNMDFAKVNRCVGPSFL